MDILNNLTWIQGRPTSRWISVIWVAFS